MPSNAPSQEPVMGSLPQSRMNSKEPAILDLMRERLTLKVFRQQRATSTGQLSHLPSDTTNSNNESS